MAIAISGTAPAGVHSLTKTVTSASFTPAANSTIIALCAVGNSSSSGTTSSLVTDSLGSSWTKIAVSGTGVTIPVIELWAMDAGSSPAARTVTMTGQANNFNPVDMAILVLTGANPAASILGATASGNAGTISLSIGTAGSYAVVGIIDTIFPTGGAFTANANTTTIDQLDDSGGTSETFAVGRSTTSQSAGAVTFGWTAPALVAGYSGAFELEQLSGAEPIVDVIMLEDGITELVLEDGTTQLIGENGTGTGGTPAGVEFASFFFG